MFSWSVRKPTRFRSGCSTGPQLGKTHHLYYFAIPLLYLRCTRADSLISNNLLHCCFMLTIVFFYSVFWLYWTLYFLQNENVAQSEMQLVCIRSTNGKVYPVRVNWFIKNTFAWTKLLPVTFRINPLPRHQKRLFIYWWRGNHWRQLEEKNGSRRKLP